MAVRSAWRRSNTSPKSGLGSEYDGPAAKQKFKAEWRRWRAAALLPDFFGIEQEVLYIKGSRWATDDDQA